LTPKEKRPHLKKGIKENNNKNQMAISFLNDTNYAEVWDQYDEVGNFLISKLCFESYPCTHFVINKSTKEKRSLSGPMILKLLQDNNLFVSDHFINYEYYNRSQNKNNTILPSCICSFVDSFFGSAAPRQRIYRDPFNIYLPKKK
jgi:hypothetical protein